MSSLTKVLIVDDNPMNVEICREILEEEFAVESACNGVEAIQMAHDNPPQVILLDVMMPGIDGYETCRNLRSLPGMRKSLIVILSAKAMPAERALGLSAGADAYITKPFSDFDLLAVIRSWKRQV